MASSDALTETLRTVTSLKLTQLDKQKKAYESALTSLLRTVDNESDSTKRVQLLVEGAESLPTMVPLKDHPNLSLKDIRHFVEQARWDPSITASSLRDHEQTVRRVLEAQSNKYAFADLYGKLVKEWISQGQTLGGEPEPDFVSIGREEMHTQRATWEDYVFTAKETDSAGIKRYLEELFTQNPSKDVQRNFGDLRKRIQEFQKDWDDDGPHFDKDSVKQCINSLLRGDSLSNQKRLIVQDFLGKDEVLIEISDVLNMRMAARKSFEWEGVSVVEQRRALNGRYRFYADEELLQSIFLHYIGLKWGVELRDALKEFIGANGVLKSPARGMSKEDYRRRRFFLGSKDAKPDFLEHRLLQYWRDNIFMDQLPERMAEVRKAYGEDKGDAEAGDDRKSPAEVVQELLQKIQSLIFLRTRLGKDMTVIRSDFKWFGPSLPHTTLFAVLEFFGINEEWMRFFRHFLEAPISFVDDAPDTAPRSRKRGTPIGSSLSAFLGEALLFCSDYAVNQKADGARLHRLHDDIWLWGDVDICVKGWNALKQFSQIMGLEFNEDKTGSVQILADRGARPTLHPDLPAGDVVWGFLKLEASSGRFVINQDKIDAHIEELRVQLSACKTVFDFVQAWNIYGSRFFQTNCGKMANCFGPEHIDSILDAFSRVQARTFPDSGGSVGQHVKDMIKKRFGVADVPDGFLYYPIEMGGLELQNPFGDIYRLRDGAVDKSPEKQFQVFLQNEEKIYSNKRHFFESLGDDRASVGYPEPTDDWADVRDEPFMSFEEYTKCREETSLTLLVTFNVMQMEPTTISWNWGEISRAVSDEYALRDMDLTNTKEWVFQVYGRDMFKRFGSVAIVEKGLLPTGLMKMLRKTRFQWQG